MFVVHSHSEAAHSTANLPPMNDDEHHGRGYRYGPTTRQPQRLEDMERVSINISGLRFETYESTLAKHPDTLLGCKARRNRYYDAEREEYFFDRHRQSFEAILYYYQSEGRLNRPPSIPWDIFYEELCFFQIEPEVLQHLSKVEGMDDDPPPILPKNKFKKRLWLLFEFPDSSVPAKCIALFSMFVILLSVTVFCLETVPGFNVNSAFNHTSSYSPEATKANAAALYDIETFCIIWFTFELITRFIACPSMWKFVYSIMNVIDFLAILPYYITLIMRLTGIDTNIDTVEALRVLRLARVFRIFKLSRHSNGLQTLGKTFKSSMNELFMLAAILIIGVVLFSSFIYFFEYQTNPKEFKSIPHAFWWAVVTMTTVGYGDLAPKSELGQLVGSFCAVTGVLLIALPVPIIVSNFTYYYKLAKMKAEHRDKRGCKCFKSSCHTNSSSDDDSEMKVVNANVQRIAIPGMPQLDHAYAMGDDTQEIPTGSDIAPTRQLSASFPRGLDESQPRIIVDTPTESRPGPTYLEPRLSIAKEEQRRAYSTASRQHSLQLETTSSGSSSIRRHTLSSTASDNTGFSMKANENSQSTADRINGDSRVNKNGSSTKSIKDTSTSKKPKENTTNGYRSGKKSIHEGVKTSNGGNGSLNTLSSPTTRDDVHIRTNLTADQTTVVKSDRREVFHDSLKDSNDSKVRRGHYINSRELPYGNSLSSSVGTLDTIGSSRYQRTDTPRQD